MDDKDKVVWILGSGFSRSLGGPLLPDFFSSLLKNRMIENGNSGWHFDDLHKKYCDQESGLSTGEHLKNKRYANAEEALEFFAKDKNDLRECRRYLGAACEHFIPNESVTNFERWGPYIRWAKALRSHDTIITFNYDRVPEVGYKATGRF